MPGLLASPYRFTDASEAPAQAAPSKGGISGFVGNLARGIAHPFAEFGTALAYTPKAIYREAQGKSVDDIQKRVFGTNDSGDIAKKIIGDTAQVGLSALTPAASSVVKQAGIGAGFGASSALAEDDSTFDSTLQGAAAGGITGGILGAGGKVLSKVLGKGEQIVEKGAGKVAARKAEQEAADKAALAVEEEAPYAAINKTGRERGNLRSTLDFFKNKLGMGTNPEELRAAATLATGDNGVISGTMRKLLGDVGTVPTESVMGSTKAALIKEAGILGDVETRGSHANGVLRSMRDTLQGTAFKGEGNLSGNGVADANSVFDTLQNVEKRIQELGEMGADAAEKRVLKAAKGALEDNIYKNGALDKAVGAYTLGADDIAAVHKAAEQAGVSPQTAQHIIDGINSATSGQELRSLQAPFVNASKLAGAADRAGEGVLTKIPDIEGNAPGMFQGKGGFYKALEIGRLAHGDVTAALPLAASMGGKGAEKGIIQRGAEGVVNKAKSLEGATPGGTANVLTRLTNQGIANAATQPQENTDAALPAEGETPGIQSSSNSLGGETGPATLFTSDNVQKLIIEDLARNKGANVDTLMKLYETFGAPTKVNPTQQKALTAASNADSALQQVESSFEAAGGGQGKVKGILNNLLGRAGLNSDVATYNDTAASLAAQIYKALGNTGTITDTDRAAIERLIPKTTDTSKTAQDKIAQLESLLVQAKDNIAVTQ